MPNCFRLVKKGKTAPATLSQVDEEICKHLNIPVDKIQYGGGQVNWFDTIGQLIAIGWELGSEKFENWANECRKCYDDPNESKYALAYEYIKDNYQAYAWYEHK